MKKIYFSFLVPHFSPRNEKLKKTEKREFLVLGDTHNWDLLAFFPDGLIDCEDPECCENPVCRKSQLCHTVPFPIDILLRKQPPSSTASFFERMKFIIEDKGLQSYVEKAGFNER